MGEIYQITKGTKALVNKESNYVQTKVIEADKKIYSIHNAEKILAESCVVHGSGIEGRREFATKILGTNINLPIAVSPEDGLYMFPTASVNSNGFVFLSYYHIKEYERSDNRLNVKFHGGTNLFVNVSLHTFNMQFKKTAQVIAAYQRKKYWE